MSSQFLKEMIAKTSIFSGGLFQSNHIMKPQAYYAALFAMPDTKRMRDKKHRRIQPHVLPLAASRLPLQTIEKKPWSVQLVKQRLDIRHFVPPQGHRVNEIAYKEAENWVKAESMELLYDCQPSDKHSPIKRVLLATHKNAQVSVMVMPHVGVSERVWRSLSAADTQSAIETLDTPATPNDFVYQYAPQAGTDLRARACLVVQADNNHDIARIESILAGINRITPMCGSMLRHCHDLLENCKKVKEQRAIEPENKFEKWWTPRWQMETVELKEGFTGYPNHIPDMVDDQNNNLYQPQDCLNFQTTLPLIHQAVLAGNRLQVQQMVAKDSNLLYQRNPWGHLPIEVANAMRDKAMAADLYEAWERLPASSQWAHSLFYRAANNTAHIEYSFIEGDDPQIRLQRADDYLSDCLPGISNALGIYQAIEKKDQVQYRRLMTAHLVTWQQLSMACKNHNTLQIACLVAELMPMRQQLFAALLKRDRNSFQTAIHDYFPDLSPLRKAIYAQPLDWNAVQINSQQTVLRDWTQLQDAIKAQQQERVKALLKRASDKWWNLKQQNSAKRYDMFEDLKRRLREQPTSVEMSTAIQLVVNYLKPWHDIQNALENQDEEAIARCQEYFTGKEKPPFLHLYPHDFGAHNRRYLKRRLVDWYELPCHFDLVYAVLTEDWEKVQSYASVQLEKARTLVANYGSLSQAAKKIVAEMPKRSTLHQQAIAGVIPDILDELYAEQVAFERVGKELQAIGEHYMEKVESSIAVIPIWLRQFKFKKVYWQEKYHEYTVEDYWRIFSRKAVFNQGDYQEFCHELDNCIEELKHSMASLHPQEDFTRFFQALKTQFYEMKRVKAEALYHFQCCLRAYGKDCQITNPIDFSVYSTALACMQFQAVIQAKKADFQYGNYAPVARLLTKYNEQLTPWQAQRFAALRNGQEVHPIPMMRILRAGLLSFERQDAWGYTPLLLAIIADKHQFVEAFLSRGLFTERVKVMHESGWYKHYSLIDHVQSAKMAELLLRYFIDANNRTQITLKPAQDLACRMRDYGHRLQLDYGKLNLKERLIGGYWPQNAVETLTRLLAYEKDPLPDGPYDKNIDKEIVACIEKHNERIAKKQAALKARPKARYLESHFEKGVMNIETEFSLPDSEGGKTYHSTIKRMADLKEQEVHQLALSFASRFKIRDENKDSQPARIDFFKQHIASNPDYFIDIYKDSSSQKISGFFCFQIKPVTHKVYGQFNVFYASIAVCNEQAAKSGLASSSFKMMLVAKRLADKEGIPLKFYGRFGRPGIAYYFIPENAKISSKFAIPSVLVRYIAEDIIGNTIEPDGSSMPPVLSTVERTHHSPQLKFFDHLIDEVHNAHHHASLPLIYDVNDEVDQCMLERLCQGNGIDKEHIEVLTEKFETMLVLHNSKRARL